MSREVLFKAKRKNWRNLPKEKWWVEGYYIYHIKRTICPLGDSIKPEDEQLVIMQDGFADWNMPRGTVVFEIAPATICQYTGVPDKNSEGIWEHDILKSTASEDRRDWKLWEVVFVDGSFIFTPFAYVEKTRKRLKCEDEVLCKDNVELYGLERVGNIFDNLEL